MAKLFCRFVGEASNAIPVDVRENEMVGNLTRNFAANAQNAGQVDKMQLFLAKTADGAWLPSNDPDVVAMRSEAISEKVQSLLNIQIDPAEEIADVFVPSPQKKQTHVLAVPVDASTSENKNKRKRKRMEDKDVPEAWIKTIKDEQITALPSTCYDLKTHLQRELRVKVSINRRLFTITLSNNTTGELSSMVDKLFEAKPRETLSDITAGILGDD